jgi:hypothetical protein
MKLWSQNIKIEVMVKKIKLFKNSKCYFSLFIQNLMFCNDPHLLFLFKDIKKEKNPMFYSNSNGDKNYVI